MTSPWRKTLPTARGGRMHLRPADTAPRCPACDGLANAARPAESASAAPKDGDLSLCAACGAVAQWTDRQTRLVPFDESTLDAEGRAQIAAAARILFRLHNYDGHGWEQINAATLAADRIVARLNADAAAVADHTGKRGGA